MSALTAAEPGTLLLFGRAAAGEWLRLRTVRTTWWFLVAAAVTIIGLGAAAAFDEAQGPVGSPSELPATFAGEFGVLPGQFALLVLALLAARVTVPVVVVTVSGVLLALVADVAAWLIAPDLVLSLSDVADSLGRIAAVLAAGGVLAIGTGLLLRSTAGALATVFLLQLVLPFLLPAFGVAWMADLGKVLPGSGAIWTLLGEPDMTAGAATAVLVAWSGAALLSGGWSLLRRDAA